MHAAKPDEGQGDNDTETVEFYEHDYSILFGTDSADETWELIDRMFRTPLIAHNFQTVHSTYTNMEIS